MNQNNGKEKENGQTDLSSEDDQDSAGNALLKFLDEMHATMPDVPEEDVQKDIEEAIAAIRNQPKS